MHSEPVVVESATESAVVPSTLVTSAVVSLLPSTADVVSDPFSLVVASSPVSVAGVVALVVAPHEQGSKRVPSSAQTCTPDPPPVHSHERVTPGMHAPPPLVGDADVSVPSLGGGASGAKQETNIIRGRAIQARIVITIAAREDGTSACRS